MSHAPRRVLFQILLLIISASSLHAQFTVVSTGLPQVYASSVAWGDYNNDGLLDIAIIGTSSTVNDNPAIDVTKNVAKIFRNNGNGTFTENTSANLMPVCIGTVAWGDYDNDGLLDLLYGGVDILSNQVTKLYHNNGDGTFTENTQTNFHSSSYGCVAWGDFDNDGYLDILVSGVDIAGSLSATKLYRNNHDGSFTEQASAGLQGVNGLSKVSFGDYDNDGYLDILLNGRTTRDWTDPQSVTKLYHNNRGNGTFTEDVNANFVNVAHGPSAFGDFNNDGFLDVVVMGVVGPAVDPQVVTAVVYLNNNGTGSFTPLTSPGLAKPSQAGVAVGDYDGDGKLDLLVNGYDSDPELFKGAGNGTFTGQTLGPPQVAFGGVGWGDFNSDGYLDALIGGTQQAGGANATTLLRNAGPGTNTSNHVNTPPAAPGQLSAAVSGDAVTLTWGRATDPETPQLGLTYAVRVGTTPGGSDVVSLPAGSNGRRRVAALGAQGLNTQWTLRGLAPGQYYWSVQAIDNGYMGSPLAAEQTFTIPLTVKVRCMLQGAYATSGDAMLNTLSTDGVLTAHFPTANIPSGAVDSVAIEIRNAPTAGSSTVLLSTPAWVLTDGTLCSFTDLTKPYVTFDAPAGSYYVVVHHRNHLAVMSANPVALSASSPLYDFTTAQAQAYGSPNAMTLVGTRYCLISGDADGNGQVQNGDVNTGIRPKLGEAGYLNADTNLNGQVQNTDVNFYTRPNLGRGTQVP